MDWNEEGIYPESKSWCNHKKTKEGSTQIPVLGKYKANVSKGDFGDYFLEKN